MSHVDPSRSIGTIALQGIALVEDGALQRALRSCYESPRGREVVRIGDSLFAGLTARRWDQDALCRFLNGYRDTHVTALYVSGLMGRVLREADAETEGRRDQLFRAARQIFEIIPEDTGVDDDPHGEIFFDFANHLVGDDRWQLGGYGNVACREFREFVKNARLKEEIEVGFLTTAASENWNTGEYTMFDGLTRAWLELLGLAVDERKLAYVTVHAGETELGHFLHALEGWRLYCEALGRKADPEKARHTLAGYLDQLGHALASLLGSLAA